VGTVVWGIMKRLEKTLGLTWGGGEKKGEYKMKGKGGDAKPAGKNEEEFGTGTPQQ